MSSPAVPSIPPLSSISDPNIRAVLQAIVDGQRIRNGDIGDGDEKFLTIGDLAAGLNANGRDGTDGSKGSAGRSASAVRTEQAIGTIIKKLSDQIMQSRAWKTLDERIAKIDMPEWFVGKFGGAIRTEQAVRESQNAAAAQQVTTAVTNINGNIAIARQEISAASDRAGAAASAVANLQAEVGPVSAKATEALNLSVSVDGTVKGTKVIAFDVAGYIAGTCLTLDQESGKTPTSSFVVRADTFSVGAPGAQDVVPFFVKGGVVYMNTAMIAKASIGTAEIADAAITTAKISALAVDTLQIAGNAVTVPSYTEGNGSGTTLQVVMAQPGFVVVMAGCNLASTSSNAGTANISISWVGNGAARGQSGLSVPGMYAGAVYASAGFDVPAGTHTFRLNVTFDTGLCQSNYLMTIGAKK
jgi:hypothetical protein